MTKQPVEAYSRPYARRLDICAPRSLTSCAPTRNRLGGRQVDGNARSSEMS